MSLPKMAGIKPGPSTDLKGRPALRDTSNTKFFLKLGCDHRLASAVIGAGGQKIKDMMNRSKTFIKLSKKGNWFPDTQCQILLIGGPTNNSLLQVLDRVMFELDHTISSLGEHTAEVKMIVPHSSMARIDHCSEQIRQLGCRIVLDERSYAIDHNIRECFVSLNGSVQSLAQSITKVNEQVQVDFMQPWYLKWGSHWILAFADELMNRIDKGAGHAKGPPPAITQPGNVQPIIDLATRFHNNPQATTTLTTEMAVEVTLDPSHAEIISAGPHSVGLRDIERKSGAQLSFAPEENGVCPLTITGLPMSIYCAHMLLMSRIVRHIEQADGGMDNGAPYGVPPGGITDPLHPHQPHAATHGLMGHQAPLPGPPGGYMSPNRRAAGLPPQGLLPRF